MADTGEFSTTCATTINPSYNLQAAQREDPRLKVVIDYKSSGMPKPPSFVWCHDPILKALWHCWDSLHIVNNMLVKSDNPESALPEYSFVIPSHLVPSVLQGIHSSPFAGHLGLKKPFCVQKNCFFWPKMKSDISHFVRSCPNCAQNKLDSSRNTDSLQHIQVSEPFVFWAMDYMGPLPETPRGNKHLLVVMDHFTKWCKIFPTPDQKARMVAQTLVSSLFGHFGPPQIIHSVQGRNFESHLMHEICQIMGTHKSRTTAYHPQCDGLVERQNHTIQDMLSAFVSQHRDDWDTWVSVIAYAYNTSTHEATGFNPYELVLGRTARTPIEIDLDIPLKNPCSQSEYSQSVRRSLRSLKQSAQQNLVASRSQQKRYHDQHLKEWVPFSLDSSVWLRRPKP